LFCPFLPIEYAKYTATNSKIHHRKEDVLEEAFTIGMSGSLVINANTNNYKALEEVSHSWCAIIAIGDFTGGNTCFPQLGVKIHCPRGTFKQLGQLEFTKMLLCKERCHP